MVANIYSRLRTLFVTITIQGKSSRGKEKAPAADYRFLNVVSEHPGQVFSGKERRRAADYQFLEAKSGHCRASRRGRSTCFASIFVLLTLIRSRGYAFLVMGGLDL